MGKKDGHYFAGRELDERAMSREAPNDAAAAAHAEMADRYEALAAVFGAKSLDEVPGDYHEGEEAVPPTGKKKRTKSVKKA